MLNSVLLRQNPHNVKASAMERGEVKKDEERRRAGWKEGRREKVAGKSGLFSANAMIFAGMAPPGQTHAGG